MRVSVTIVMLLFLMFFPLTGQTGESVEIGLSVDSEGIKAFHLAVGNHFQVEYRDVVSARERKLANEELPVVYFIARHADVAPGAVIKMRLKGQSWLQIAFNFGLDASYFHVPVKHKPGPPYGKAYGQFKNKKRSHWRQIRLTDLEIVDLVNLRFISEHYGYAPEEVMKMREKGRAFVVINGEIKKAREKKAQAFVDPGESSEAKKSKGKGKGKKK
ncbi:MAG: hypothetical protein GY867_11650 [bacterium]|nr:hypothetical protein [bacterium]